MNKGLICHHLFCVATYSQSATYHITFIPSCWYIKPNVNQEALLQQYQPLHYVLQSIQKKIFLSLMHEGHSPKRLQSNVEQSSSKGKYVLRNNTQQIDIYNDENAEGSKRQFHQDCWSY
ncbi:unnamed protein product [Rhizophagus irregularis]|nr:unnamed protein product [Rhizophagus irregularis]